MPWCPACNSCITIRRRDFGIRSRTPYMMNPSSEMLSWSLTGQYCSMEGSSWCLSSGKTYWMVLNSCWYSTSCTEALFFLCFSLCFLDNDSASLVKCVVSEYVSSECVTVAPAFSCQTSDRISVSGDGKFYRSSKRAIRTLVLIIWLKLPVYPEIRRCPTRNGDGTIISFNTRV